MNSASAIVSDCLDIYENITSPFKLEKELIINLTFNKSAGIDSSNPFSLFAINSPLK